MGKKQTGRGDAAGSESASQDALFEELLGTLSAISGSLGAIALRLAPAREKLHTEGDKMLYLSKLGLDRKVIAGIMASTEGTVSTRLSEMTSKKSAKKSAKKPSKKPAKKPAKNRPTTRRRRSGNR